MTSAFYCLLQCSQYVVAIDKVHFMATGDWPLKLRPISPCHFFFRSKIIFFLFSPNLHSFVFVLKLGLYPGQLFMVRDFKYFGFFSL